MPACHGTLEPANPLSNALLIHSIHLRVAGTFRHRVCSAELFRDGVIVTFTDGNSALFSADLLHASLSQAQDLTHQTDDSEDPIGNQGDVAVDVPRL